MDSQEEISSADIIQQIDCSEDAYQCQLCKVTFTDIEEHIKTHHNEPDEISEEVEEEILFEEVADSESEEINLALIVKNSEDKYECNDCPKTFKNYGRFINHLKTYHNLTVEDYGSLEKGQFQRAKESECQELKRDGVTIYRCRTCNAEFDTRKRLLLHVSIHQNVRQAQKNSTSTSSQENINCQLCNKTFANKIEFELHVQAHEENRQSKPEKAVPKKPGKPQKGIHPCQYCGKEFKRPHEKVKHERIHSGLKPYSCDICGKQFRVTYCLSLHKRNVHSDDRPYICTFPDCNKRFKAQSVYNHHINTHSDERKFQCPFCSKAFKTSVQLAGHKNTHTKPFSCQICKRPFSSLYAVKNHMTIHGNEDSNLKLSCKICGAQYARPFALKDHLKTAHSEIEVDPTEEYIIESEIDDENNGSSEVYSVVLSETADNMTD